MLWEEGGLAGWFALVVNAAAIGFTGDIPSVLLRNLSAKIQITEGGSLGRMLVALSTRPIPILLLVLGVFYLWVFARRAVPLFARNRVERLESATVPRSHTILEREGDCA